MRLEIKTELVTARSRIYISFNRWFLSNRLVIIKVVIYYFDKDLINRSYLIDMRRINGTYISENITKTIIPILLEIGILLKLDYFIANNDSRNDTYIRAILRKLRFNIKDSNSRRIRCLGYIINLAAKAFLFGKNADAFKNIIDTARKNDYLEALREK
jgi:hypothetical protein